MIAAHIARNKDPVSFMVGEGGIERDPDWHAFYIERFAA